jgi:hypothetical protein
LVEKIGNNNIFSAADLRNFFLVLGKEKREEINLNKYISLTKFINNYALGFFSRKESFKPIFRNVAEIILILILHFSQNQLLNYNLFLNYLCNDTKQTT